jgi:hypothetical protein
MVVILTLQQPEALHRGEVGDLNLANVNAPRFRKRADILRELVRELHRRQFFERLAHDHIADDSSRRILESLYATVDLQNEILGAFYRAADDRRDDDRFVVFRHQTRGPDYDRMNCRVGRESSLDTERDEPIETRLQLAHDDSETKHDAGPLIAKQ